MKKGEIELETVVKIVLVLFALIVIAMFLTGNFAGIGAGVTNISHNVTGQEPGVADRIMGFNISMPKG